MHDPPIERLSRPIPAKALDSLVAFAVELVQWEAQTPSLGLVLTSLSASPCKRPISPHPIRLLRVRRERPRHRTAEQPDELAAFHVDFARRSRRPAMERVINGNGVAGFNSVAPRTTLSPEEEVSRAGLRVTQSYRRTRWLDGRAFVWLGGPQANRARRGRERSGLRYIGPEAFIVAPMRRSPPIRTLHACVHGAVYSHGWSGRAAHFPAQN
jgi:hypothetical protein